MRLKGLIDEDFTQYKKPCMFLITPCCSFKCDREYGAPICQNSALAKAPVVDILETSLISRYLNNPITKAIVLGGMEPFDSFNEVYYFISQLRKHTIDDVVIYTGYIPVEIEDKLNQLKEFKNIYIKCGRYIPGDEPHFDEVLGVNLASNNQYGFKL